MIIKVNGAKIAWSSPDKQRTIYDLTLDNGSKMQTYSDKIAEGGEFDVEVYQKGANSFVRQLPKEQTTLDAPERKFVADPLKQSSIEWQSSLARGVEAVRDYYTFKPDELPKNLMDYKKDIVNAAITFAMTVEMKPEVKVGEDDTIEDAGDHARINQEEVPIENYDDLH
jgi:hypothetical protein